MICKHFCFLQRSNVIHIINSKQYKKFEWYITHWLMSLTSCFAISTTLKPLLYGQCVVCFSGTAGDAGNKLAFLTLAKVFSSTPHPSFSSLPFIWPLQGMTTCLCCPPYRIFRWKAHIGLTWEIRFMSLVYGRGRLDLDVVEMITSRRNARFMMQSNLKLEKQEV